MGMTAWEDTVHQAVSEACRGRGLTPGSRKRVNIGKQRYRDERPLAVTPNSNHVFNHHLSLVLTKKKTDAHYTHGTKITKCLRHYPDSLTRSRKQIRQITPHARPTIFVLKISMAQKSSEWKRVGNYNNVAGESMSVRQNLKSQPFKVWFNFLTL